MKLLHKLSTLIKAAIGAPAEQEDVPRPPVDTPVAHKEPPSSLQHERVADILQSRLTSDADTQGKKGD